MAIRLAAFDLDGTLVREQTCVMAIASAIGRTEECAEFEKQSSATILGSKVGKSRLEPVTHHGEEALDPPEAQSVSQQPKPRRSTSPPESPMVRVVARNLRRQVEQAISATEVAIGEDAAKEERWVSVHPREESLALVRSGDAWLAVLKDVRITNCSQTHRLSLGLSLRLRTGGPKASSDCRRERTSSATHEGRPRNQLAPGSS